MLTAFAHALPLLATEKSKVPFYIAGGALAAWAVIVSLGIGLRRPDFPGSVAAERTVIAISALLVVAAMSTAVLTADTPSKAGAATSSASAPTPAPQTSTSAAGQTTSASASTTAAPAAASTVAVAADPTGLLRFTQQKLQASAGKVTFTFTNASPLMHNLTIEAGRKVLGGTPTFQGGSKTLTLNLPAGTYVFFCSVPGHRQAGMQGTLTVS